MNGGPCMASSSAKKNHVQQFKDEDGPLIEVETSRR